MIRRLLADANSPRRTNDASGSGQLSKAGGLTEVRLYADFLHLGPSLLTALAAVGLALLFRIPRNDFRVATVFVTVLMTQFSISAMNEWADRDRDAAANRPRLVAMGRIRPQVALVIAGLCALAAIPGSVYFGALSLVIVIGGVSLGWAYDLALKPTPLSFLPFAIAFPLLAFWVGIVAGHPAKALLYLFVGGAPLAVAIHLADAIPDRDPDRRVSVRTLAVMLGQPWAEVGAAAALLTAGVLAFGRIWSQEPRSADPLSVLLGALTTILVAASYLLLMLGPSLIPFSLRQPLAKWGLIIWAGVVGVYLALPVARG